MASIPSASFKLFKTVIDDTINNVREAFLDEGVDEQILQELKQIWETKLVQSRAVDTGVAPQQHHVQPYHDMQAAAQMAQTQRAKSQASRARTPAVSHQGNVQTTQVLTQARNQQAAQTTSYIAPASSAGHLDSTLSPQAAAATLALPQGVLQLQPHQLTQLPPGFTLPPGMTVGGQQFPAYQVQGGSSNLGGFQIVHQPVAVQQQQQQPQVVTEQGQVRPRQIITFTTQGGTTFSSTDGTTFTTQGGAPVQASLLQVDGGNDTSDEEDEYDEDDNDDNDDDEAEEKDELQNDVEEEPLNSDDDVSDEDPAELFDTDNVVVCQYDRINRNRNKWKFTLKSGIMNLKGKDFVFFKATGDAEW